MLASTIREMANRKKLSSEDLWWSANFRDTLFEAILTRADKGEFDLKIGLSDYLNKDGLLQSERLMDKVKKELKILGYKVEYYKGSYQCDGDDKYLKISW